MLDKLEELAKAATPGPWMTPDHALIVHQKHAPCPAVCFVMTKSGACENHAHNAAYIAAANPETILRLVRVARAAKAILAHHDEGARPDQIALDELRAALKETI